MNDSNFASFELDGEVSFDLFKNGESLELLVEPIEMKDRGPSFPSFLIPRAMSRAFDVLYPNSINSVMGLSNNCIYVTSYKTSRLKDMVLKVFDYMNENVSVGIKITKINEISVSDDHFQIRSAIESFICNKLEANGWIYIQDQSYIWANLGQRDGYCLSNLVISSRFIEGIKIGAKRGFCNAKKIMSKESRGKIRISIRAKIAQKKFPKSTFLEEVVSRKRVAPTPCLCIPRMATLYVHELIPRNNVWIYPYWFLAYGIKIKEIGTDALCSFSGDDDDSIFEYPIECIFGSYPIDYPLHITQRFNDFKSYAEGFFIRIISKLQK